MCQMGFAAYAACLLVVARFQGSSAQYPGHGISKSTYSSNDPHTGKAFLEKYFPVDTPGDECDGDFCHCSASGSTPAWEIMQGRVYTKMKKDVDGRRLPDAGNGFGLHLVNVSEHWTTGGMSTAEVEAEFTQKLGDLSKFDAFMDYNVIFSTDGLADYKKTFDADGVKYLAGTWTSSDGDAYTSIIVRVPGTQMILELVQKTSLTNLEVEPMSLEQRVPTSLLRLTAGSTVGSLLTPLVVGRAASAAAMAKLEDFYVSGMGTTMTQNTNSGGVVKKCFRWTGATVDVCYTQRDDSATSGSWKVADFENMLNTVHKNLMEGHPFCGMDKWEDNHYAIDSQSADTSKIVDYINTKKPYHYCQSGGPGVDVGFPPSGGASVHYIWDPTGWAIQLDLQFSTSPDDCKSSAFSVPNLRGDGNPVCTLEPDKCPSQATVVV